MELSDAVEENTVAVHRCTDAIDRLTDLLNVYIAKTEADLDRLHIRMSRVEQNGKR